jgi:hypothetical protein
MVWPQEFHPGCVRLSPGEWFDLLRSAFLEIDAAEIKCLFFLFLEPVVLHLLPPQFGQLLLEGHFLPLVFLLDVLAAFVRSPS